MKNYRLIYSFTIAGLLLSIIACGSSEPIIETAAAELNFAADDLGSAWSLSQELVMNELLTDIPDHALDANQRTFVSEDVAGKVMVSLIYSTNSVSSA